MFARASRWWSVQFLDFRVYEWTCCFLNYPATSAGFLGRKKKLLADGCGQGGTKCKLTKDDAFVVSSTDDQFLMKTRVSESVVRVDYALNIITWVVMMLLKPKFRLIFSFELGPLAILLCLFINSWEKEK